MPKPLHGSGWLAEAVDRVCAAVMAGDLKPVRSLTPSTIAKLVQNHCQLDAPPSAGAVAAVFARWEEYGYARFARDPFRFVGLTPEGEQLGLHGLLEVRRLARKRGEKRPTARAAATRKQRPPEQDLRPPRAATTSRANGSGPLAEAVLRACDACLSGEVEPGRPLTPTVIARLVQRREGLVKAPSNGAVAAVFERWERFGFAEFDRGPLAFKRYTAGGLEKGLAGILEERRRAGSNGDRTPPTHRAHDSEQLAVRERSKASVDEVLTLLGFD